VLIQIEEPDQEIERVEPFQRKAAQIDFGTKVAHHFEGWIRVVVNSFV
jgi:hypothetical protein